MNDITRARFTPRPLTEVEYRLARWMLENGGSEAQTFLPQLERATVVGRCGCGCASIDFAIDGFPPPSGGLQPLAEFYFREGDESSGIFIFEHKGVLGGIEVYSYGDDAPATLPTPEELHIALDEG